MGLRDHDGRAEELSGRAKKHPFTAARETHEQHELPEEVFKRERRKVEPDAEGSGGGKRRGTERDRSTGE